MIDIFGPSIASFALSLGISPQRFGIILLAIIILWTIPWKGVALWKASHRQEKWWFIVLLVINTIGILEILYIFVFSKKTSESPSTPR
ncbi:MAG: DUF5652 family protein [Patescibacteria group bacterium]|mgnify:CR=1 FL=1